MISNKHSVLYSLTGTDDPFQAFFKCIDKLVDHFPPNVNSFLNKNDFILLDITSLKNINIY